MFAEWQVALMIPAGIITISGVVGGIAHCIHNDSICNCVSRCAKEILDCIKDIPDCIKDTSQAAKDLAKCVADCTKAGCERMRNCFGCVFGTHTQEATPERSSVLEQEVVQV